MTFRTLIIPSAHVQLACDLAAAAAGAGLKLYQEGTEQ